MAEATTPAAKRGSGRKAMGEITSRRVLAIALPIVLSNATIPLLGMVDTGVVGQLGRAEPIGAVAIGAVILTSLYWVFSFLRMGTSGLVAQAHGAGDARASGAHLLRALAIAGVAGVVLIALQGPLVGIAFRLSPASAEVEALARDYLSIRIWGAPAPTIRPRRSPRGSRPAPATGPASPPTTPPPASPTRRPAHPSPAPSRTTGPARC